MKAIDTLLEVVPMTVADLRAQVDRHAPPPSTAPEAPEALLDEPSLAEEIVRGFSRSRNAQARNAERRIERIVAEAQEWEYQLIGGEDLTGRKPLPL